MAIGFADITGITASTCKLLNNFGLKGFRNRIFAREHGSDFKRSEYNFNIDIVFTELNNYFVESILCERRKLTNKGQFKITGLKIRSHFP